MSADGDLFATEADSQLFTEPEPAAELEDDDEPATNLYDDVFAFVTEHLAHVYARPTEKSGALTWCAQWHHHPEALARLTALWKAFEALRTDPGAGMSTWWIEHADPMMAALTAQDGTFRNCNPEQHRNSPVLPTASPTQS